MRARGRGFATAGDFAFTLKDALSKAEAKKLISLAACDFYVGPLESDNMFSMTPEEFVPGLLKNMPDLDFASIDSHAMGDSHWILEFPNTKRSERQAFILSKLDKGWTWISFATSDARLLGILYGAKSKARK